MHQGEEGNTVTIPMKDCHGGGRNVKIFLEFLTTVGGGCFHPLISLFFFFSLKLINTVKSKQIGVKINKY